MFTAYFCRRESGTNFWKSNGCTTVDFKNGSVMCSCNHLTHFAILISPGVEVHDYSIGNITSAFMYEMHVVALLYTSVPHEESKRMLGICDVTSRQLQQYLQNGRQNKQ